MMINTTKALDTLLVTNEAFNMLNAEQKELIKNSFDCIAYESGNTIFVEGDLPTRLLCLTEGKVKIYLEGVGGREQILRMAQPKGFIGYRALFADENYVASARAIEDSVVIAIPKEVLSEIMTDNPLFTKKMMQLMAQELGFANRRIVALTQKHIRARLAETLLFLMETYGFEDDGKTIHAYLSRQDIAGLSNMTTSNAIRTLSNFATEGLIDLHGKRIKLRDINKLSKISDMG